MDLFQLEVEPLDTAVALMLEGFSAPERSEELGEMAQIEIDAAQQINARVFLRDIPMSIFVDGVLNAPLNTVNPDHGRIFTQFKPLVDVFVYIAQLLEQFSPVKTGRYKKSHVLFADGRPIDISAPSLGLQITEASEFVFVNTVPYARKIERGLSQQAPDGVYQAVAGMARRKYSWIAKITFSYRSIFGGASGGERGDRHPAIVVRIK